MKKNTIIFWVITALLCAMMLFSAFAYFTNPTVQEGFRTIGFPDYFRIELGVAKILGALALLIPAVPQGIKFAAYVGFAIVFVSAAISHWVTQGAGEAVAPLVFLVLLGASYWMYNKTQVATPALATH
jgi:hypothetical protein